MAYSDFNPLQQSAAMTCGIGQLGNASQLCGTNAQRQTARTAIEEFDGALKHLEALASRASTMADVIIGPELQAVQSDSASCPPSNLISQISARREFLVQLTGRLESALNRIEAGIG